MHDIIVVGTSSGGIHALQELFKTLPQDFPASIFVVLHLSPYLKSNLPDILGKYTLLKTAFPKTEEKIQPGYIYIASPNHHLIIEKGVVHSTDGPSENGFRPAIDTLFRSAAFAYGRRVIGVVLSGALDDGTGGLASIKVHGGLALVQDPEEADFDSMPRSAIENVDVDYVLPVSEIAQKLIQLVHLEDNETVTTMDTHNPFESQPSPEAAMHFSCPDCGGVLSPMKDGNFIYFRCEVGHSYSPQTLLNDKNIAIESALWAAMRTLQEKARISDLVSANLRSRGHDVSALRVEETTQATQKHIDIIRELIKQLNFVNENTDVP